MKEQAKIILAYIRANLYLLAKGMWKGEQLETGYTMDGRVKWISTSRFIDTDTWDNLKCFYYRGL